MNNEKIVVLIPAYNPTEDLIPLTDELLSNGFRVLVVNDGSNETTSKIFKRLNENVVFIEHEINKGKGQALKTGFEYIHKNIPCEGVVTADADGQHLLKDIINVGNTLIENPKDLIIGSRKQDKSMLFRSRLGNTITRFVFKTVTGTKVYDTQSGLRGIPYSYLQDFLKIEGSRYEYEINVLLYCSKNKIKIKEIEISTVYIDNNSASSFKVVKDSVKIYKCILNGSNIATAFLYAVSAVLSFFIDFSILMVLNNFLDISNEHVKLLTCVLIARAISSMFNFIFNRTVVFKSKSNVIKELLKYYILVVFVITINYLLLDVLAIKLNWNLKVSKVIVEVLLFFFNYLVQKLSIFKNKTDKV